MPRWIWIIIAFGLAFGLFWLTRTDVLFGDVQSKGVSEVTEWIKLTISLVSLAIGLVNLRIVLVKAKDK